MLCSLNRLLSVKQQLFKICFSNSGQAVLKITTARSRLSGRGGAMVRARASDIVVGGCEFKFRHCHLTGHIPDQLMPGPLIPP